MIKKFEPFQDNFYEEKKISIDRYKEIKNKSGSTIPFEEVEFLINNIVGEDFFVSHRVKFITKEGKEVGTINNQSLKLKDLSELKNKDIIGVSWSTVYEIFKDDDEWFWLKCRLGSADKIFKCDEFSGLKKCLIDKGYIKGKKY